MKRLFVCFLFLSCFSIMWSHLLNPQTIAGDTIIHQIYEIGPELKEQEYMQKRKIFKDSLFSYLIKAHKEDILDIKDSVVINFVVNGYGHVDSVWVVFPAISSFKNICEFIKRYDFQGPLAEFYTSKPELYDCTIKLVLLLNRDTRMLYISVNFIHIKKRSLYTYHLRSFQSIIPIDTIGWDGIKRGKQPLYKGDPLLKEVIVVGQKK